MSELPAEVTPELPWPEEERRRRLQELAARAMGLREAALAPATRRAYARAGRQWQRFCLLHGLDHSVPDPRSVALFLASIRPLSLSRSRQLVAALRHGFSRRGTPLADPAGLLRDISRGLAREDAARPRRRAHALSRDELKAMLAPLPDTTAGRRDRAVLTLGFAGALRRSELVALDIGDIRFTAAGLVLRIRRSKTDPEGDEAFLTVCRDPDPALDAVSALIAWLECRSDGEALFLSLRRGDHLSRRRLSDRAVDDLIKARARAAGILARGVSGHSLRAGYITDAHQRGVPFAAILAHSRHKDPATALGYFRPEG